MCSSVSKLWVPPAIVAANTSRRYGLPMAGIGASASPPRGPGEVALPHHCGRSQPLMGPAAHAPEETLPTRSWNGAGGWKGGIPELPACDAQAGEVVTHCWKPPPSTSRSFQRCRWQAVG